MSLRPRSARWCAGSRRGGVRRASSPGCAPSAVTRSTRGGASTRTRRPSSWPKTLPSPCGARVAVRARGRPHADAVEQRELASLVQRVLDHLPAHYGSVLEWKYLDELPVRDIASRLNLSEKAAESLLTRARAAFRDAVDAIAPDLAPRPGGARMERRRERHRRSHSPGRTAPRACRVSRRARPGGGRGRVARDPRSPIALDGVALGCRGRCTCYWLALWFRPTARPVAPRPSEVATVVRVDGSVRLVSSPSPERLLAIGERLVAGAAVDTTAGGRVALQLASGSHCASRRARGSWSKRHRSSGSNTARSTWTRSRARRRREDGSADAAGHRSQRGHTLRGRGRFGRRPHSRPKGEVRVDRAGPEVRVIAGGVVSILPDGASSGGRHRRSGRTGPGSRPSHRRS